MAPLVVLLLTLAVDSSALRLLRGRWRPGFAGRIAAAVMFLLTRVSHFIFTDNMAKMVPTALPAARFRVLFTGVLEILGGLRRLIELTGRPAAWCLAVFLVAVFPANIYASLERVGVGGHTEGPGYLWIHGPLQFVFLTWVVIFGLLADRQRGAPP